MVKPYKLVGVRTLAMPTKDDIASRLREYVKRTRLELGMTQQDLAKKGQIPLSTIGSLESEQRSSVPSPETLLGLAKGLGVHILSIMRVIEGKPPDLAADELVLASLMRDLSDDGKRLVLEWLTMPPNQRAAVEAGLSALLTALRRQSQGP